MKRIGGLEDGRPHVLARYSLASLEDDRPHVLARYLLASLEDDRPHVLARCSLASLAWLAIAAALLVACSDEERSHVYGGRQYEGARDCVDGTSAIDVVDGPLPASPCDPRCILAQPDDAGTRAIYVSTMCAPFPPAFDVTGSAPECTAALSAYARNDTCLEDGGTTAPRDAGAAEDAAK